MNLAAQLAGGLHALNVPAAPEMIEKLLAFQSLLAKWNGIYNLTAIREPERMLTHHLLDSLAVLRGLPDRSGLRLLDVGAGGGMPGVPLAIARPDWSVTLLDSNQKKTAFLQQAVAELGLRNVTVVTKRVEHCESVEGFDVVISRAFADLAQFARLAGHLVRSGGAMMAMKGIHPQEEIAQLPPPWQAVAVEPLQVPGLDADRHLVTLLKVA